MDKAYFVYILASKRNGTLYTGVTNDLVRRVWEHKTGAAEGFTRKYHVHMLVGSKNMETSATRSSARSRSRVGTAHGN